MGVKLPGDNMKLSHFIYAVLGLMSLTVLTTLGLAYTADYQQQTNDILGGGLSMFAFEFFVLIFGGMIVDASNW